VENLRLELEPAQIGIIFDQDAMINYWIPAFTHKTVDATNNYETLEFYGDKVLNYSFSQYLRRRLGKDLDESKGTLLINMYMSKMYQAELASRMGLPELIRYDPEEPKLSTSIKEDAFEAFSGALNNLAEDKIKPGLGPVYIFNMLVKLFEDVEINLEDVRRDVITELKEIYEKMGWGAPFYDTQESDNPQLGPKKTEIRSRTGIVLGVGYGNTDISKFEAAKQALETLSSEGVTWESADKAKLERTRERNRDFDEQYQRVEAAMKKFNEKARALGKVHANSFKLMNIDNRKVGGRMRYTYSLQLSYPTASGHLKWVDAGSKSGPDSDQVRVELMKEFADKYLV
jgi:dsRNA-specific ribonuclease